MQALQPSSKHASARVALVRGQKEINEVESLRRMAYDSAPEFVVLKPSAYQWTEDDASGKVLAVWDNDGTMLATMRGSVVGGRQEAEHHFECSVELDDAFFPALLLERGATCSGKSCGGLNSLMRYYFIDAAMRAELRSVLGAVFEGAPRIRLLSQLGYVFEKPERVWDANIAPRTRLLVASLSHERFKFACGLLHDSVAEISKRYLWDGPTISLVPLNRSV